PRAVRTYQLLLLAVVGNLHVARNLRHGRGSRKDVAQSSSRDNDDATQRRQPTSSALTRPSGPPSPRGRGQTFQRLCLPFPRRGRGARGEGASPYGGTSRLGVPLQSLQFASQVG